jgi:hypothetical protein
MVALQAHQPVVLLGLLFYPLYPDGLQGDG